MIPLLVIAGPTASGKTKVAAVTARLLNGEIISADSMQVYRYMDIGSAKPDMLERQGIAHHLIDIVDPDADFTAAIYQKAAREAICNVHLRGYIPILTGGTGFYIDAVLYDYDFSGAEADPEFRSAMWKKAELEGNKALHNLLREVDPLAAAQIHVNDLKRIVRALEIQKQTGAAGNLCRTNHRQIYPQYNTLFIGLCYQRELLYQRIEKRVDLMLQRGLVEEVQYLLDRGYHSGLNSMQGLGYKEIASFLAEEYTLEEAGQMLKRNTRRFAKRQLTWFKRYSSIKWIDMEKYDTIEEVAEEIGRLWRSCRETL